MTLATQNRRGGFRDALRVIWRLMLSNSVHAVMQFTEKSAAESARMDV